MYSYTVNNAAALTCEQPSKYGDTESDSEEGKLVACLCTSMAALPWIYPLQLCFGHVTGSPCWEHCIQAVEQTCLSVRQSLRLGILNSFSLHALSGGAANETRSDQGLEHHLYAEGFGYHGNRRTQFVFSNSRLLTQHIRECYQLCPGPFLISLSKSTSNMSFVIMQ